MIQLVQTLQSANIRRHCAYIYMCITFCVKSAKNLSAEITLNNNRFLAILQRIVLCVFPGVFNDT